MMRTKKGGGSKFEGLEQDLLFSQIYAGLTLGQHLFLSFTFVWDNLPFETFAQILESYHGALILFLAEWLKVLIAKYVSGHEKILSLPYFIDPVRGDLAKGTTLRRAVLRLKRLLHQLKPLKKVWNSGIVMIELLALIIYVILCFGAPVFSLQAQTLAFACLLLILTFLPVILIQGPDLSLLMAAMLDSENDGMNCLTILLRNNAFGTLVGAWLGALPIPLDWDRPWQVWPMTCSLGALAGNAFGSLTTLNGFKKHTISRLPPFGRKKQR